MRQCSDSRGRIRRDGTSQARRRLAALDPASAPVDQRGVEDFLAFALQFSRRVLHFEAAGVSGTWEPFFGCDPSAIIAAIEKTNPKPIRDAILEALAGAPVPETLGRLFQLLADVAQRLDTWLQSVGTATDYREQIRRRIRSNLAAPLCRLVQYNLAAADRLDGVPRLDFASFSEAWSLDLCQAAPDDSLFGDSDLIEVQIAAAMERLQALFVPLYKVLLDVIGLAPRYFDEDLGVRRDHEPHFALFVAFLRLYLIVRDDANKLTQRHLDFFYDKVLGIRKRAPDPDHLHLLVQLARQVKDDHLLAAGSELDAGKDDTGVPLRYVVDENLVANRAQVAAFKTVYVEYDRDATGFASVRPILNVTAAPIANSKDGLGAELEDTERPSWKTLGSADMPGATLGFAIASRMLLLAEGKRIITLELQAENLPENLTSKSIKQAFQVQLSGEKGWIPQVPDCLDVEGEVQGNTLKIEVVLKNDTEAVTFANAKVLGEDFGTTLPILKVTLRHSAPGASFTYQSVKEVALQNVTLKVRVQGIRTVVVQNDDFVMDPSKPFLPFGSSPGVGSNFYVGSGEAFQKKLTSLTLHVTWDKLPDSSFATYYEGYRPNAELPSLNAFQAEVALLQDGVWGNPFNTVQLFNGDDDQEGKPAADRELNVNPIGQEARIIDELTGWTSTVGNGFLRLSLKDPTFFHDDFVNVMTRQAIAVARMPKCTAGALYRIGEDLGNGGYETGICRGRRVREEYEPILPNSPYTPAIKAISLDYGASVDTESEPEELQFFHIEPFGRRRVELKVPEGDGQPDLLSQYDSEGSLYLLPQFEHEGTLYLGVRDLQPPQSLSILFQVAEGTADTDVRKPKVQWAYLSSDVWKDFQEHEITADSTRGLIASGIVTFSIPPGITADNTLLPGGLHWLRAQVDIDAGGVSELISAHAQAARATFVDHGNDPKRLEVPLEAGTLSGLVRDDARIAGIEQPYDSFGGRAAESGLAFYTRVSEHLRHKGRAITVFDYERLVLENFRGLYKVKCINHMDRDHALSPGQVLIAVIPDFRQLKAVDRRRPKVTLDELDDIATFLQSLNCPFVRNDRRDGRARLHVLNPLYEEVQVELKVRFQPEVSAPGFYKHKLKEAINRFLSPWAFEDAADIAFGGTVYKSSILSVVEKQPYVDYVTEFVMKLGYDTKDLDAIEASTPRSILVPADSHNIEPLTQPTCPLKQPTPGEDAIGHLTLDHDFEI